MDKPFIVSMTTHGDRTPVVTRILKPTVKSAEKVGATVALTLHRADVKRMTDELRSMVDEGDVELIVSEEDYGSNLKYLAAMRRHPDVPVLVHDDDVIFHDAMFREMAEFSKAFPNAIGCRIARKMGWSGTAWPAEFNMVNYVKLKAVDITEAAPLKDCLPEGCKGVVYPAGCFRELLEDKAMLSDIREHCLHDDDVALRLMAIRTGTPTYLVPSEKMCEVDYYADLSLEPEMPHDELVRRTALWRQGNWGKRSTNCLRHFARELWFYGRRM